MCKSASVCSSIDDLASRKSLSNVDIDHSLLLVLNNLFEFFLIFKHIKILFIYCCMTNEEQAFYMTHIRDMPFLIELVVNDFRDIFYNSELDIVLTKYYGHKYRATITKYVVPIIKKMKPITRELNSIMKHLKDMHQIPI